MVSFGKRREFGGVASGNSIRGILCFALLSLMFGALPGAAQAARGAGLESATVQSDLSMANFRTALREFRSRVDGADVALIDHAGPAIEGQRKSRLLPAFASSIRRPTIPRRRSIPAACPYSG